MAAVDLVAIASEMMLDTAPAAARGAGQRPAVLAIGWQQLESAAEKRAAEAALAMAEAVTVMEVAAAAAVAVRKSHQSGLAKPAAPHPRWAE